MTHTPSPSAQALPPRRAGLRFALRSGTREAHERLERRLDWVRREPDRRRFVDVLKRFHGFHQTWEDAVRRRPNLSAFQEPRSRLPHLRRDLLALGLGRAELRALPHCHDAGGLLDSDAGGVGSIYVMEGSTLGGQLIDRAIAGAAWLPEGGLRYFNPYGPDTGRMWRAFEAWAEAKVGVDDYPSALRGARSTFALLERWLAA